MLFVGCVLCVLFCLLFVVTCVLSCLFYVVCCLLMLLVVCSSLRVLRRVVFVLCYLLNVNGSLLCIV